MYITQSICLYIVIFFNEEGRLSPKTFAKYVYDITKSETLYLLNSIKKQSNIYKYNCIVNIMYHFINMIKSFYANVTRMAIKYHCLLFYA
jgi:hypothetical protein